MTELDRRDFLARALAPLGLSTVTFGQGRDLIAQPRLQQPGHRIDLHHHFGPPTWVAAMREAGQLRSPANPMGLLSPANTTWTA